MFIVRSGGVVYMNTQGVVYMNTQKPYSDTTPYSVSKHAKKTVCTRLAVYGVVQHNSVHFVPCDLIFSELGHIG